MSVLIVKGTEGKSEETILPESGACTKSELFVSDEGACWMPTLHKSEKVGQGSSIFLITGNVNFSHSVWALLRRSRVVRWCLRVPANGSYRLLSIPTG